MRFFCLCSPLILKVIIKKFSPEKTKNGRRRLFFCWEKEKKKEKDGRKKKGMQGEKEIKGRVNEWKLDKKEEEISKG